MDATKVAMDVIQKQIPHVYKTCLHRGIDITTTPLEVAPGSHTWLGGLAVEAGTVDGREIVAADALDVLLHVHRAARPFPVDARDEHAEIARKVAGEALRVARLHGEVKLALERAAQLADEAIPLKQHLAAGAA